MKVKVFSSLPELRQRNNMSSSRPARRENETQLVSYYGEADLKIFLNGKTGAGKTILRKKEAFVSTTCSSVTSGCKKEIGEFEGPSLGVIGTPEEAIRRAEESYALGYAFGMLMEARRNAAESFARGYAFGMFAGRSHGDSYNAGVTMGIFTTTGAAVGAVLGGTIGAAAGAAVGVAVGVAVGAAVGAAAAALKRNYCTIQ